MKEIEQLLEQALELEQRGEKEMALETLSQAFDLLIDQAGVYAKTQLSSSADSEIVRAQAPLLIEYANTYLRQNLTAAMILNNMGLLFVALEQYEAALKKFEEAISLTPTTLEYDDPADNIQHVLATVAELQPTEEENPLAE